MRGDDMNKLNILVIGAGMYVCGRGTDGYGTIMPAICEWAKTNSIGEVCIEGKSPEGVGEAKAKIQELQQKMGTEVPIIYFSGRENNKYIEAMREISRPACAIIALPDNLHKEAAYSAISEGLHTLVVKPLVPTIKEALELVEMQIKKQVYCAVEFHKRLDYANIKLKDTIEQGAIGDPLYFLVEFSQRKSMPTKVFKKWIASTNVFQYLGIHYVDIIYFVTGAVPKRVMATGQKNWLVSNGIDAYDSIQGVIEWEAPSGKSFTSYIMTNWVDPESMSAMSEQGIKVIGTKGRFESDQKRRGIRIVIDGKGIEEPNPYFCGAYGTPGNIAYRGYGIDSIHQFLKDVIDVEDGLSKIEELEYKRATFKQSVIPVTVLEGVNNSLANNGKWLNIGI